LHHTWIQLVNEILPEIRDLAVVPDTGGQLRERRRLAAR
jgi:hypothetical protein